MGGHAEDSIYALLTDGATVEIRPARPGDFAAVRDMHVKMSHSSGFEPRPYYWSDTVDQARAVVADVSVSSCCHGGGQGAGGMDGWASRGVIS